MKRYKDSWKEFDQLRNIDARFYASDCYDMNVNNYRVKTGTLLKCWENKGCINKMTDGCFQWYFRYWLGRRLKDDERQINRWKNIVSRFRGKLVKTIKDVVVKLIII